MRRIKSAELQAGMVMAEDVFGPHGELLMPKGSQVDDRSMKTLNHWNISYVSIEGDAVDPLASFTPEQVEQVQKEITSRFITDYADNSTVNQLIKECTFRQLEKQFGPPPAPETPPPAPADPNAAQPAPAQPEAPAQQPQAQAPAEQPSTSQPAS